jgi:hypothetical protein
MPSSSSLPARLLVVAAYAAAMAVVEATVVFYLRRLFVPQHGAALALLRAPRRRPTPATSAPGST